MAQPARFTASGRKKGENCWFHWLHWCPNRGNHTHKLINGNAARAALANSGDEANQKTTTLPCTRIFIEYRRNHHHHQENVGKQNKVYVFVDCHRSLGFGQNTERTWKGRGERAQPDPGDDESVVTSIKLNQTVQIVVESR